jgi:uncharacterized protein YjiS (DUF1127 family)
MTAIAYPGLRTRALRRLSTYDIQRRARARRARFIARSLAGVARAIAAVFVLAWEQQRKRARARAMYDELCALDDRTLHDMGFERSEIMSVAAEATGEAQRTRALAIFG